MFDKPELVEGPRFKIKEGEKGTGKVGKPTIGKSSEGTDIGDGEPSDLGKPVIFVLPSEGMTFSNAFEARIEYGVKGKRSDGSAGEIDIEKPSKSTEEDPQKPCSTHEATLNGVGQ